MNFQRKTLRLFYCDGDMHASLRDKGSRTVFRVAGQSLAELRIGAVDSVSLLSVNNAGSVVGVAQENEWEQFDYTAYGHCSSLSAGPSSLGFNGEYYDDFLQGYMLGNGYRLFNGMRFNSPDSFAPFRVLNAYGYCDGDPINYTDPSGHIALFKGLFRPRGYNTSKQLIKSMKNMVPSLERSVRRVYYDPSMGDPAAFEAQHTEKFLASKEQLTALRSKLEDISKSNPAGFMRASNKLGYGLLDASAKKLLDKFQSKIVDVFDGARAQYNAWLEFDQKRLSVENFNRSYKNRLSQINARIAQMGSSYKGGKGDYWRPDTDLQKRAQFNHELTQEIRALEAEAAVIRRSMRPLPKYPI